MDIAEAEKDEGAGMKVYIERTAVMNVLEQYYPGVNERLYIVKDITSLPAADVAPVVRCKDCIYAKERFGHLECDLGITIRKIWNSPDTFFGKGNNPNMFCSYGERREECETD